MLACICFLSQENNVSISPLTLHLMCSVGAGFPTGGGGVRHHHGGGGERGLRQRHRLPDHRRLPGERPGQETPRAGGHVSMLHGDRGLIHSETLDRYGHGYLSQNAMWTD